MKTLNKVKTSIWINALSAIIIGILFLINPQESFQNISCYCLTLPGVLFLMFEAYFKTSHVIV